MSRVEVVETLSVAASSERVVEYLIEMTHLSHYEPKVNSVEVEPQSSELGTYTARGWFGIIPWAGTFTYALRDDGFDSQMISGPWWGYPN